MSVYVCYEENYHEIADENGPIEELRICRTAELAMKWFLERVKAADEYNFVNDVENRKVIDGQIDTSKLFEEINSGYSSLIVFKGFQENWAISYAIRVSREEVIDE